MSKSNPFEYVNAICEHNDIISNADDPTLTEDGYNPHLINRSLSYHVDAVLYSNEMNQYPGLDKKLQFLYYIHSLSKRKRIAKWHKPDNITNDLVDLIQFFYPVNSARARDTLKLLSKEQIEQLRQTRMEMLLQST